MRNCSESRNFTPFLREEIGNGTDVGEEIGNGTDVGEEFEQRSRVCVALSVEGAGTLGSSGVTAESRQGKVIGHR